MRFLVGSNYRDETPLGRSLIHEENIRHRAGACGGRWGVYGLMTKLPSSSFQTSKPSKPSSFRSLLSKPPSAASFLILILLLRSFLLGTTSPIHPGHLELPGSSRKAPTPQGAPRQRPQPPRSSFQAPNSSFKITLKF